MIKHYHLIGIGGIGMSGIAKLLLRNGIKVSGSDIKESKAIDELRDLGAQVFIGHNREFIKGVDFIIYSSAIKDDNPEILEAKRLNLPLLKRAQALAGLMQDKTVITITGSHGKTTTTSLVSYLLLESGLYPTVAIGGILRNIDTNAYFGNGNYFVAEADESDGSFLYYQPRYSIITNIDYEHIDYYKNFENEVNVFWKFINNTRADGCVIVCADDNNLKNMLRNYKNRYILFGLKDCADIFPKNIEFEGLRSCFDCFYKNKFIDRFNLSLAGEHNISNALSVIVLGLQLDIDLRFIKKALSDYRGVNRRLEIKFDNNDILLIDDYAHHPTEIKATLKALKYLKKSRIIAVFQPHRYTRTKLLLDEFSRAFDLADYIIITDIYPASEPPIEGIDAKCLFDKIKKYTPDKEITLLAKENIVSHILEIIERGDLIITLGAGDISKISDELVENLRRKD
jgi:UDP-N-acetylmuramate--alanine ligase